MVCVGSLLQNHEEIQTTLFLLVQCRQPVPFLSLQGEGPNPGHPHHAGTIPLAVILSPNEDSLIAAGSCTASNMWRQPKSAASYGQATHSKPKKKKKCVWSPTRQQLSSESFLIASASLLLKDQELEYMFWGTRTKKKMCSYCLVPSFSSFSML